MEEEQPKSPVPEAAVDAAEELPAPPLHDLDTDKQDSPAETKADSEEQKPDETKEPTDWFEPLEDDDGEDANSFEFPAEQRALGPKDLEEESVAGESERSESIASSEKSIRRTRKPARRRQFRGTDEGWEDCPSLGEGWKRKETIRQSGTRSGQSDIYYMSPTGERARSRIELSILMNRDLSSFEFKSGVFKSNGVQRLTLQRRKRKTRDHSTPDVAADQTSDSSFVERGEGADTPDSHHRLTPSVSSKSAPSQAPSTTDSPKTPQIKQEKSETPPPPPPPPPPPKDDNFQRPGDHIKLPSTTSSKPLHFPSINGEFGPDDSFLVCARCGLTFTGTRYDQQRKKPYCPSCWAFKAKEHPLVRLRKWTPCGQCVGCRNKVNCGHCRNCKERSSAIRKRTCRKRKCLSPILKGPGGVLVTPKQNDEPPEDSQDFTYYNHLNVPSGDTEDFTTPLEMDEDDDGSSDDDEDWHKRRKRRACGDCPACLRKDCGTCDFCIDKPKFGGSNKKRQKCRLRQCQRQAMRHLLPSQFGGDADDSTIWGRAKPQYTYSRKRKRPPPSDDEDDEKSQQTNNSVEFASSSKTSYKQNIRKKQLSMQVNNSVYGQPNGVSVDDHHDSPFKYSPESKSHASYGQRQEDDDEEDFPTITQIYSLADEQSDLNKEHDLMKMLDSLRSSALPILWYAVMVEGPQIQLVQCSKLSAMADTTVQINTDFTYNILVQRHPLLPTHPLYDAHPLHLDSVSAAVALLLDLDKYVVCHGIPPTQTVLSRNPIILERAPTCRFLIKKNETICTNCRMLCE